MEHRGYDYKVSACITLTRRELQLLMNMSEGHYDHTCRKLAGLGGVLYGLKNWMEEEDSVDATLSQGQINLLCKVMEQPMPTKFSMALTFEPLRTRMIELFKRVSAETERMQSNDETPPPFTHPHDTDGK